MENKIAIITGASGDIGSEITKLFASNGYNVIACYNTSKNKLDKLSNFNNIFPFKADLTKEKDIKAVVEYTKNSFGKIDVLINCAGIALNKMVLDVEISEIKNLFETNVYSTILLSKAVLPYMIEQREGSIINISSILSKGASCEAIYSSTKEAIESFSKSLALEYGSANIRVNTVSPGFIDTKMNNNLSLEEKEEIKKSTLLGRLGKPSDVASLCLFLASDEASFITGQNIGVDGGGF